MGDEARQYIEKRIQYLDSNEGLKETKKPSHGKVTGDRQEGYGQRSEMLRRKPNEGFSSETHGVKKVKKY